MVYIHSGKQFVPNHRTSSDHKWTCNGQPAQVNCSVKPPKTLHQLLLTLSSQTAPLWKCCSTTVMRWLYLQKGTLVYERLGTDMCIGFPHSLLFGRPLIHWIPLICLHLLHWDCTAWFCTLKTSQSSRIMRLQNILWKLQLHPIQQLSSQHPPCLRSQQQPLGLLSLQNILLPLLLLYLHHWRWLFRAPSPKSPSQGGSSMPKSPMQGGSTSTVSTWYAQGHSATTATRGH